MADGRDVGIGSPMPISQDLMLDVFANVALDASTDKVAWVVQAPAAATITRLGFRHASLTGTPPTYKISLQGVSTTGVPDGTVKGGALPASATFTPTAGGGYGTGTWHWITLDNSFAVARGDFLAVVIEYSAGVIDISNFSSCTMGINAGTSIRPGLPYALSDTTGTWTKNTGDAPIYGLGSSTTAYGAPLAGVTTLNASSTAELGMRFLLPAEWGDTFQVVGARWSGITGSIGRLTSLTLYSGGDAASPTILQQIELDTDFITVGASGDRPLTVFFDEATLVTLSFGTAYHVALAHNSALATLPALRVYDVAAVADWDAWPGRRIFSGINRTISTYPPSADDTNAFTETITRRPMMELILADITEPAGGGGLLRASLSGGVL